MPSPTCLVSPKLPSEAFLKRALQLQLHLAEQPASFRAWYAARHTPASRPHTTARSGRAGPRCPCLALASSSGIETTTTAPQPRVEQIPHGVAEHVETVHGNRQAKTRPESQPWRHLHVETPLPAEHTPPARNLGRQTESQEAQGSLSHNHRTDVDAEYDDYRRRNIGQDMSNEYSPFCIANRLCHLKIGVLLYTNNSASHYSRAADSSRYPQDQYYL